MQRIPMSNQLYKTYYHLKYCTTVIKTFCSPSVFNNILNTTIKTDDLRVELFQIYLKLTTYI